MAKVLPGFETILILPAVEVDGVPWIVTPTGLVDYEDPTAASLNVYQAITKPSQTNAAQGGNVSCVILDDLDLGLTGSDTDDQKTVCSKGNSSVLTLHKFNAKLNARRDADPTADSQENLFRDLTWQPDVPYFIAHRVKGGKDSTEAFAIDDEVDLYYVNTDIQVNTFPDGKPIQVEASFIQKAIVNVGHVLTA